ncbi:ribonuclease III domain-containing protein [Microcoleus sp. MON1_C1]|uniref:Mini-ribonuclease 3 n=1 Tax=Microcoleus TaxID=44471 RepID=UPI00020D2B46|nr:ribonuclease III [Microcoleus vaginatus FGP-2]MBD1810588.1 ribonuclease III [Microcoleus sp. FACHB-DQ6]UNU20532.1 ribonuclease III [Microcoleus vaginatus PCC 9802]
MSPIADDGLKLSLTDISLNRVHPARATPAEIERISPAAWAYLGDAVYELYVRSSYLVPPKKLQAYHELVVGQVRAETQARHLRSLSPYLNSTELAIVKRGRNAAAGRSKRADPEIYQQASSLETLVGYLYLTDPERLTELLGLLDLET